MRVILNVGIVFLTLITEQELSKSISLSLVRGRCVGVGASKS